MSEHFLATQVLRWIRGILTASQDYGQPSARLWVSYTSKADITPRQQNGRKGSLCIAIHSDPLRPFIERFASSVQAVAEVLEILKNKGLNQQTYRRCCQLAEQLPKRSKVKKRLLAWLQRHLHIQCRLGISQMPLMVSSDIIESLFGKFKHIIERSPQADMNRTTLVIPALCGKIDGQAIAHRLAHTTHADIQRWEQQNIPYTLRKRRRAFFNGKGDQKPGKLQCL